MTKLEHTKKSKHILIPVKYSVKHTYYPVSNQILLVTGGQRQYSADLSVISPTAGQ